MEISAEHVSSAHGEDTCVGIIYGDIGTNSLRCSVTSFLEKNDYVQIPHES